MVSRSDRGPGSLPLSAYGKLPLSREFLRVRCDTAPARTFREFLDHAAPHCAGHDLSAARPSYVLTSLPQGRTGVLAGVWPSADEGHLRPFPFSCFVAFEQVGRHASPPQSWTSLQECLESLHAAYEGAASQSDGMAFDDYFRGLSGAPGPGANGDPATTRRASAGGVSLQAWANAVYRGDTEALTAALWRLRMVIGAERAPRDLTGVRVPLAEDQPLAPQVDAWLEIPGLNGQGEGLPDLVVSHMATPCLSLFFDRLRPEHMATIRTGDVPGIIDLTSYEEPAELDGFGEFHALVIRHLNDPEDSLASLHAIVTA